MKASILMEALLRAAQLHAAAGVARVDVEAALAKLRDEKGHRHADAAEHVMELLMHSFSLQKAHEAGLLSAAGFAGLDRSADVVMAHYVRKNARRSHQGTDDERAMELLEDGSALCTIAMQHFDQLMGSD